MVAKPTSPDIDLRKLSARQLDGYACVSCGGERGPMEPITLAVGIQHIVHAKGQCVQPDNRATA